MRSWHSVSCWPSRRALKAGAHVAKLKSTTCDRRGARSLRYVLLVRFRFSAVVGQGHKLLGHQPGRHRSHCSENGDALRQNAGEIAGYMML